MNALIRKGEPVADEWQSIADDAPVPASGAVIVSLARWQGEADQLRGRGSPTGVRLPNTVDVTSVWPLLADRPLIALDFPAFGDGRAYSQARVLRDRFGYGGSIRAGGAAVVRDQLQGMMRCGIDTFELRSDQDPALCAKAFADFSIPYQTAADGMPSVFRRRRG